jgi:hypothetical protein
VREGVPTSTTPSQIPFPQRQQLAWQLNCSLQNCWLLPQKPSAPQHWPARHVPLPPAPQRARAGRASAANVAANKPKALSYTGGERSTAAWGGLGNAVAYR